MKKLILSIAIILGLGMASFAEGGGLFGHGQSAAEDNTTSTYNRDGLVPALPGQHNTNTNQPAPVGSGIAVLIGLGAAYAFAKKREE